MIPAFISGFVVAVIIYAIMGTYDMKFPMLRNRPPKSERKNMAREKNLMSMLLKDIKENGGNWTQNGLSPITMDTNVFINDNKNIMIRYNEGMPRISIYLDVKDFKTDPIVIPEDAILTHIEGKHTQKFINTMISELNYRGKELSYMTDQLKQDL